MQLLSSETLLSDLTEPQRQATTHVDGPLLIIAGAGSGKTRVITRRVAYLISIGIPPSQILAITFTNKAAGEMKQRVAAATGRPARDFGRLDQPWPMICTFHSLCLRILRHYHTQIGLPANFTIYDSADQNKVVKDALKGLEMSATNFPPSQMHSTISDAKNKLITPQQYAAAANGFYEKNVARVYSKYQQMLDANQALDFDDLLMKAVIAFRDHPQMLAELQERFQYILIDEYQDTNHAQYMLAHALAMKHRNICVVGDPDQSIYAWRGADIRNILEFERDYPDATVVKLEKNYRSTQRILELASALIANNTQRKDKRLWTENEQGPQATLALCQDEHDEAYWVADQLKTEHEQNQRDWNDMAIFYRINALSRVMEEALRKSGIPYQIARGVEFYNRREIKDVMAYLKVIANPADEVSLTRIVNTPARGIGAASVKLMQVRAIANGCSLFEAMRNAARIQGLSARAVKSTEAFVGLIEEWRRMAGLADQPGAAGDDALFNPAEATRHHRPVRDIVENVVQRSGLEAMYRKESLERDTEGEGAIENIAELISSAAEFDAEHEDGTLVDYVATISLVSDADHMKGAGGAVTLMTLHAAKGLEFPVVAMIGMEEGILPHSRARDSHAELEEERRLCFVGITRAQEKLYLSKGAYRTVRGLRDRTITSPFLNELPQEAVEIIDRAELSLDRDDEQRQRMAEDNERLSSQFRQGQLVRHPQFGMGRIAAISNMGRQTRAIVQFNTAGRKTLILEYARLEAVG